MLDPCYAFSLPALSSLHLEALDKPQDPYFPPDTLSPLGRYLMIVTLDTS